MSLSGLCEICEQSTAEYSCDLCGRQVCAKHYDEASGTCTDCPSGRPPSGQRESEDMPDGVDTYEF